MKIILFNNIIFKISFNFILFVFITALYNSYLYANFSLDLFVDFYDKESNDTLTYSVLLKNGDIYSGKISVCYTKFDLSMPENASINANSISLYNVRNNSNYYADTYLPFIILNNISDETIIYEDEILNIVKKSSAPRQNHSLYLMPTANPISNNHFIGNYEALFLYGGFGITDWVSITAGRSIIPQSINNEQISLINSKISLPSFGKQGESNFTFALGANLAWINTQNRMLHLFGVATYNSINMNHSNFSVGMFYKLGHQEYPSVVHLMSNRFEFLMDYPDGSFGLCAGLERRFETRNDLSLLIEIWNSDVSRPTNSGVLLGFRLAGRHVYSDFGIAIFTQPFLAPFFSFNWLPFN